MFTIIAIGVGVVLGVAGVAFAGIVWWLNWAFGFLLEDEGNDDW